jgi:hypothetical protein
MPRRHPSRDNQTDLFTGAATDIVEAASAQHWLPGVEWRSGAAYQRSCAREHLLRADARFKLAIRLGVLGTVATIGVSAICGLTLGVWGLPVPMSVGAAWSGYIAFVVRSYYRHLSEERTCRLAAAHLDVLDGAATLVRTDAARMKLAELLIRDREFCERMQNGETTEALELAKLRQRRRSARVRSERTDGGGDSSVACLGGDGSK